jgi:hypothetical protein
MSFSAKTEFEQHPCNQPYKTPAFRRKSLAYRGKVLSPVKRGNDLKVQRATTSPYRPAVSTGFVYPLAEHSLFNNLLGFQQKAPPSLPRSPFGQRLLHSSHGKPDDATV